MAIDYSNPTVRDQVRLLISDVDDTNRVLRDDMIDGFLVVEGQSVKRAAATALEAIASSETLVSKVIKTQDLATNGPAVAADLRAHAASLRAQAEIDEDDANAFSLVPFNPYAPSVAELAEMPTGWPL